MLFPRRQLAWVLLIWVWCQSQPCAAPAQQVAEVEQLRRRLAELELRAHGFDALAAETARLHDDVGALSARLQQYESWPRRLPPITREVRPLPLSAEHTVSFQDGPVLDVDAGTPSMELREAGAADDSYGYGRGFDLTFWGWISYLRTPQEQYSTFWAWEAEFDVTKSFTENLSAAADIDFEDEEREAEVNIEQLFLSMLLPNLDDAIFTAGKFNAPYGIERRDFWDRLTGSTSLLFRAMPRDLVGVMFTQPCDEVDMIFRAFVVNGFENSLDINQQPSIGLMVEYRPCDDFSLATTSYWGPEFEENTHDKLYFNVAQATWLVASSLSLSGEVLYGTTDSPSGQLDWTGYALIASQNVWEPCRVFFQWSDLSDRDGFITGDAERRQQGSVGLAWYLHEHVEGRIEYRRDFYRERYFGGFEPEDSDNYSAHFTFGF